MKLQNLLSELASVGSIYFLSDKWADSYQIDLRNGYYLLFEYNEKGLKAYLCNMDCSPCFRRVYLKQVERENDLVTFRFMKGLVVNYRVEAGYEWRVSN